MDNLILQLEALLFYKNEPTKITDLAKIFSVEPDEIKKALTEIKQTLSRGIRLSEVGDEVVLVTAPEASELIEKINKEELSKELSKAQLEVLSIVLYKGPVTRREIDYIRGVNSSYILRNLAIRGLIQKSEGEKSERINSYIATLELLNFLGISSLQDLPQYDTVRNTIQNEQQTEHTN
jgi:segregation and condensation protein B